MPKPVSATSDPSGLHLPLLRAGRPYRSLDTAELTDIRTGEVLGTVSQAIPGILARDLARAAENRAALDAFRVQELVEICHRAARLFGDEELPLYPGAEVMQTPDDYLDALAATAGMPVVMGEANMAKITDVMGRIEDVLDGLTRGLDLSVLDGGWGSQGGRRLSYQRLSETLGAVLPNNSPGVHNLWLPAFALKIKLVLRPGGAEPWTPYRMISALIQAGAPAEAFSLYPSGHGAVPELLTKTGRSMFFGDASTVAGWRGSGKVQVHGPGWSKVILDRQAAGNWQPHLDMLVDSVLRNGGRSCINCSGVWTAGHGREIADAMARELAQVEAVPLGHPESRLAAFPNPGVAHAISDMIDDELRAGGAEDLTARYRDTPRVAEAGGCTFLLPTVVHTDDPGHPLAKAEYIFPYVTVVDCPEERLL
ncbi:MAG: aldehyde dehydrogenase family protein, partial [Holophagales bacterium]|nr:aldehyde dehydrogenase family protein [Holophagales bacterium]